ncbi:MFS general substrate transporter [Dendrothele bispora CBS 962.96]|uniref:MFS general substrate transporter n=1 Tax=Dendrothele bispora (strain CBS 962.96) TaxID=1314807 RepID=A0A4S8KVE5_DENBC|nr:MFS general substrate transporter [Dendrothele bispora CBS 962.96]
MSDEKGYDTSDTGSHGGEARVYERYTGWKGIYYHPITQVSMLGFVCFMCPGLFNALTGLGGGGQVDSRTNSNSNAALYSTFAVMAFFAGSVNNKLGSKLTLLLGSFGYCLFIGSYLAMNIHPDAGGFVIGAGAVLGICAGLLWTAQGSIMLSYPTEAEKGRYIAIFWAIFNLGGVVGAAVSLGQNIHSTVIGNGTYIGFLVLTAIGITLPLFMADPKKMIRTDGTKVPIPLEPSWKTQIYGLWVALRTDPLIILLFPMFFASNWFYTWQFSGFNGAIFNIRARALNNLLYWSSQIFGSIFMSFILDLKRFRRRTRAFSSWIILLLMTFVIHTWAYFYQKSYTRDTYPPNDDSQKIDIYEPQYIGKAFLYVLFGVFDAMWQSSIYWLMGAMSNDPAKLAYFAGFYKAIQSAGNAGIWRADAVLTPYMNMFLSTWILLVAGLVFALPMIYLRVKDHTEAADETMYA